MRQFLHKYHLLVWIAVILAGGFFATGLASYLASREMIEHSISEQALPLTGDNIYSEIQKDILRPVFISSLMAQDTFVRDWVLNGERNSEQIVRYLNEVKTKYGTIASFLISERSHVYYYAGGTLKSVREDTPRDAWYFRLRKMDAEYETNVDFDMANRDKMTIFINHKVLDYQGRFIGATGVGLTLDMMSSIIDNYQARFHRNIYFVGTDGNIVLTGKSKQATRGAIGSLPGISAIAADILNRNVAPSTLSYPSGKSTILVNSRFIPELGWYLIVEQNISDEIRPLRAVFAFNLALSAGVTVLVMVLTLLTVNRYRRRLEKAAATDTLTGLLNRQALELIFRNAVLVSKRSGRPLSAILFDIDLFKQVNDRHGHLWGDSVIRAVAGVAREVVRESDVVTRWGGEEYLILLNNCSLQQAAEVAETLRSNIERHDFGLPQPGQAITVSLGVAQYQDTETESAFFGRADSALYQAKNGGRNRVELSARHTRLDSAPASRAA